MRSLPFLLLAILLHALMPKAAWAAGRIRYNTVSTQVGSVVTVTWVGDASGGSVPTLTLPLTGLVAKVVTNPGSPAPTANYDIACGDPTDSTFDIFAGALMNRHTTSTEQVYPVISGATMPVYAGTCTLQVTNNSVNSATGTIEFYVLRP